MFKKFLVASSVLSLCINVAIANPVPYVGANIGLAVNTIDKDKVHSSSHNRGVPFNVFVGYGGTVKDNFYLAGELNGTIANAEVSGNSKLKTSFGYGVSILPGMMLSDHTLAYARAGVVETRFSNLNSTRAGAQVGLGMQTSITQNLDLRGEADITAYKSLDKETLKGNPYTDAFNVGLVYKIE